MYFIDPINHRWTVFTYALQSAYMIKKNPPWMIDEQIKMANDAIDKCKNDKEKLELMKTLLKKAKVKNLNYKINL